MFNSGYRNRRASDGTGIVNSQLNYIQTRTPNPAITGWTISGSDDTALNPAGGQTVLVNGSGFASGISATLNGIQIGAVTLVSPTQLSFTAPANSGGSYTLVVYNANGGAAILVPGLTYSSIPTYSTAAGSIGSYYETTAVSTSVTATSDSALTYTLASGSLPSGATLFGNGVITGTSPVESGSTTYTFAITATDAELQDVTRTFTLTINTDVVTWSSPDDGTTYTNSVDTAISNVSLSASSAAGYTVSYAANTLPTGVTLSNNTISGTPTVVQSVTTQLTATSATTNRSATRTINWVITILGDVYFKNTTMLLSANNSVTTSSFITDNSLNNALITTVGDSRAQNFNPYQFGYYSVYFDGSSYITAADTLDIYAQPVTFEGWVYPTVAGYAPIFEENTGGSNGEQMFYITTGQILVFEQRNTHGYGSTIGLSTTLTAPVGVWTHVALSLTSQGPRIFVNGVQSATDSTLRYWNNAARSLYIGVSGYGGTFTGYMSNLRITRGVIYPSNFTPSTTPLLALPQTSFLICQSNRIIDASLSNNSLTKTGSLKVFAAHPFTTVLQAGTQYYGAYFDGTGDYLSTAVGLTSLDLTSGDFTLECWVYNSGAGAERYLFSQRGASSGWEFRINATNLCQFFYTGGSSLTSTGTITGSTWTHLAVTRSGTTVRIFINGALDSSATFSNGTSAAGSYGLYIGYGTTGGGYMLGCISNARINKGQALYTAAFTPATSPLTTTSQGATAGNVELLTCQSSTIIDNSSNAFAITANGDTKTVAQSPFVPAYYSGYFNGSTDYLTLASNAAFGFGTGDFTVEMWFNVTTKGVQWIFDTRDNGNTSQARFNISVNSNNSMYPVVAVGTTNVITSSIQVTGGQWYHMAVTRSGTSLKLFLNGVQAGSATNSTDVGASASPCIGTVGDARGTYDGYLQGYVTNLRVVKGQALYTSAFTPTTSPLTTTSQSATASNVSLLTCQNLYFVDNSTNAFTVTRNGTPKTVPSVPFTQPTGYDSTEVTTWGSGYFDGTGDYLTIPSSTGLTIGTNSATVEFWIYPTSVSGYQRLVTSTNGAFNTGSFVIRFNNGTFLAGAGGNNVNSATVPEINQWSHIAWVGVTGSTQRLYINGVSVGTSTTYNLTEAIQYIGGYYTTGPAEYANGYMSDVRVIKGTALYTSAFTPTFTTSLTAVTNTQLLTLQTRSAHNNSTFTDGSGFTTLITRTGNTTNGTFSPYGNNWSCYFDGTTDALTVASGSAVTFGTGDFTIEFWVYYITNDADYDVFCSVGSNVSIGYYTAQGWYLVYNNGIGGFPSAYKIQSGVQIPLNTWAHVACSRASGVTRLFLNGTQAGSSYSDTTSYSSGNTVLGTSGASYSPNCYISNFRVLTGTGLYTANFNPPTTPLTSITNTSVLTCQSNRFIDSSIYNSAVTKSGDVSIQKFNPFGTVTVPTYYSNYFDGSGDYLNLAANTAFSFGTGDFTVECWVNYTNKTNSGIFQIGATLFPAVNGIGLGLDNGPNWMLYYGNGSQTAAVTGPTNGVWYHVAVVRSSSVTKVYVNGSSTISTADSANYTGSTLGIAGIYSTSYLMNGYISNFRVTKGQALYTTTFTPATSPLTTTSQSATAANVSLLTCQSSTLIDNSLNYFTITANGDVKPTAVSPFTPTASDVLPYSAATFGGSMYFDGTGDYLQVPNGDPSSSGDVTLEFWVYPYALDIERWPISNGTNGTGAWAVGILTTGAVTVWLDAYSSAKITSALTIRAGAWSHIAIVKTGGVVYVYVNGIKDANTYSQAGSFGGYNSSYPITVGSYSFSAGSYPYYGYISDIRFIKGLAMYTSNFVPLISPMTSVGIKPGTTTNYSAAMLITGTSGGIIDASRTVDFESLGDAKAVQNGPYSGSYYSNLFDGSSAYLSGTTTALNIGTSSFTVEFWIYKNNAWSTSDQYIIDNNVSGGLQIWIITSNGTLRLGRYGVDVILDYSYSTLSAGVWYHMAYTRSGSNLALFVNGTRVATATSSASFASGGTQNIGRGTGASGYLSGYISNFRVVNGSAVYDPTLTTLTVPITPLSAVSGTSLLTCQSNKFVDNSSNAFTLTAGGTPKVQTQNPFAVNTGTAYYFDGTGDYLNSPIGNLTADLSVGDFTVECWVYFNSVTGSQIVTARSAYATTTGSDYQWGIYASGTTLYVRPYQSTTDYSISVGTITIGQWYYVTLVRNGTTVMGFLNGVKSGTTKTVTGALNNNTAWYGVLVGNNQLSGANQPFNGYITDLRITKGYARYTATFTPPTTPAFIK